MRFIKFIFKLIFGIALFSILFIALLTGLSMWLGPKLAPKLISDYIESQTSFPTKIESLSIQYLKGSANINHITIDNPSQFTNKNFVDIQSINTTINYPSLLTKNIIIEELSIDLAKIALIMAQNQEINALDFAHNFKQHQKPKDSPSKKSETSAKSSIIEQPLPNKQTFLIKKLTIKIEHFEISGFPGTVDKPKSFEINYSKEFKDVNNLETVLKQVADDLKAYGINALMQSLLEKPLSTILDTVNQTTLDKLKDTLGTSLPSDANQVLDGVLGSGSNATKSIEKGLNKLFGK